MIEAAEAISQQGIDPVWFLLSSPAAVIASVWGVRVQQKAEKRETARERMLDEAYAEDRERERRRREDLVHTAMFGTTEGTTVYKGLINTVEGLAERQVTIGEEVTDARDSAAEAASESRRVAGELAAKVEHTATVLATKVDEATAELAATVGRANEGLSTDIRAVDATLQEHIRVDEQFQETVRTWREEDMETRRDDA